MPRRYDEAFWADLLGRQGKRRAADDLLKELGF